MMLTGKLDEIPKYTRKITLTITKCDDEFCWYYDKIGEQFVFWNKIFKTDQGFKSLWLAEKPVVCYVHLVDSSVKSYQMI